MNTYPHTNICVLEKKRYEKQAKRGIDSDGQAKSNRRRINLCLNFIRTEMEENINKFKILFTIIVFDRQICLKNESNKKMLVYTGNIPCLTKVITFI